MKKIGMLCLAAVLMATSFSWSTQTGMGVVFSIMNVAEAAQKTPANVLVTKKLAIGEVTVYDFGKIKLHAYKTNDALGDVCYLVENEKNIVILESAAFTEVV